MRTYTPLLLVGSLLGFANDCYGLEANNPDEQTPPTNTKPTARQTTVARQVSAAPVETARQLPQLRHKSTKATQYTYAVQVETAPDVKPYRSGRRRR